MELLKTALQADPHDFECRYQLAQAYDRLDRPAEAAEQRRLLENSRQLLRELGDLNREAIKKPRPPPTLAAKNGWVQIATQKAVTSFKGDAAMSNGRILAVARNHGSALEVLGANARCTSSPMPAREMSRTRAARRLREGGKVHEAS